MTQREQILEYIKEHGSITPMDAFYRYNITKLATRISEMRRMGINFIKVMETKSHEDGRTVRYMRYYLDEEGQNG